MKKCIFLLSLFSVSNWSCSAEGGPSLSRLTQAVSRRSLYSFSRSIPALSVWTSRRGSTTHSKSVEVAVKKRRRPNITFPTIDVRSGLLSGSGFYYGIASDTLSKASSGEPKRRRNLSDSMYEALEELKFLRQEMETMRKEVQSLRGKMLVDGDIEVDSEEEKAKKVVLQRRRAKEADRLSIEIENWANQILDETEEDGWKPVECSKRLRKSLDPEGQTTASIKWMKDSRGVRADKNDQSEYPCIRCSSIIDAPLEDVCTYLSQETAAPDYNDMVVKHKDVEDISPSAKICASWTPQILFIKQREFVTLCHHRWKRDGSEIIVNQAWDHEDYPASTDEKGQKACRAYALRGANMISRCPDDPEKTVLTLIAHGSPGGNVPGWACKTAVNALAPVEPFKLFQKINKHVKQNQPKLRERLQEAEMVSLPGGRSPRPAGIAQLGYACFWPNGGGVIEGGKLPKVPSIENDTGMPSSDEQDEGGMGDPSENDEEY
eukprot:scaffold22596_cov131-Cylindrotheca_fusiformis.AAC.23